jgi:uncharacterized protein YjdB
MTPTLTSIAVTPAAPSVNFGGTQQMRATGSYSDGTTKDLTASAAWSSSATSIATVNGAGVATGVSSGTASILATSKGITGSTSLTVAAGLSKITVGPASATLNVGGTTQFSATGTYQDSSSKDITSTVTWTTSAGSVATISSGGLATAVKSGTATVTAAQGAISGTAGLTVNSTLQSITLSPNPVNVTVGGSSVQLTATGHYSDGSSNVITSQVSWSSSASGIASVSSGGSVSGVKSGTATVSASLNGISGSTAVTCSATQTGVTIAPLNPSILQGGTQQFTATATYNDGTTQDVTSTATWTSSATGIATVSGAGLATGVKPGTANIKAVSGAFFAQTTLTVGPVLTSITVGPANPSIGVGSTQQFTATGTYSDGSTQILTSSVTWSSSAPTIATISAAGLATAVKNGTTTVSASLSGVTGSTAMTVTIVLTGIAIAPLNGSVNVGSTLQYTATGTYSDGSTQNITGSVNWTSSNTAIATVSTGGLVSGVKSGTANIKATSGGLFAQTGLTVNGVLVSIAVTPAGSSVNVGSALQYTATGTYNDGTTNDITASVTWSSSDASIATISSGGLASGVKGGSATITATSNSISGSTGLTVNAVLTGIAVAPLNGSVNVGSTLQYSATGTYNDGTTKDITSSVTWSSSSTAIATISSAGLATGVKGGSCNIKAASGGLFAQTGLTVNSLLVSIAVTPAASSVFVGSTLQMTATGTYNDGTTSNITSTVSWSSNSGDATVNNAGLVTGVLGGSSTITATLGSVNGSTGLTITALLKSIAVSPAGAAVSVGGTQQMTATGTFNDGTTQNLTSTATWSASNFAKATISNTGLVTGVAAGPTNIIAAQTAADGTVITGSTALNVASGVPPVLNGEYAFYLQGADSRGPQSYVGNFTADGSGNITGGAEDANTGAGVLANVAITGTYTLGMDGRGTITLNANSIHPTGIVLRFILASNGNVGRLVQFDGKGTLKGAFEPQSAGLTAASLNGTYVFRLTGIDAAANAVGEVGMLAANGSGSVTSGVLDTNDNGAVSSSVALIANSYSVGLNGRGTIALQTASGTANYVFYMVNASKLYLTQSDAGVAELSGVAELQASQTYSASSLMGGYAFQLDQPVLLTSNPLTDRAEFNKIGRWAFDGVSAITGVQDEDNNYSKNPVTGITGAYAVSGSGINGRGTLTEVTSIGNRSYVFYMVSKSKMYVLETLLGSVGGSKNAPIGVAEQQSGAPFGVGTLNGSLALALSELTESYTEMLVQVDFDGLGGVDGIADLSIAGALSTSVLNANYSSSTSPNPDPTVGRGVLSMPSPLGAANFVFYLVSPDRAFVLGITPDLAGDLNLQ